MRAGDEHTHIDKLVHKVVFHLHETFADNVRTIHAPGPFCVKENGYGEFDLGIDIYFSGASSDEKYSLVYFLELPGPNSMQQLNRLRKEKISFLNPSPALRRILIESGGARVKSTSSTLTRTTPSAITPPPLPSFTSLNLKKSINPTSNSSGVTSLLSNISSASITNNNRHSVNGSSTAGNGGPLVSKVPSSLNSSSHLNHVNESASPSVLLNKKKLNDSGGIVNGGANININRKV